MAEKSFPTVRGLQQLDSAQVLRNTHEIKNESLRVLDTDTLVGEFFTRADVTYNIQGSATSASFYYDKNNHIEQISTIADVSGSLNNTYFTVDGPQDVNKYYIWYNVNGGGTDPAIPNRIGIQVPLMTDEVAVVVAIATRMAMNINATFSSDFQVANADNRITLNAKKFGQVTFSDISTSFGFNTISIGETELVKEITLPYENGIRYVYNEYTKRFEIFQEDNSGASVLADTPDVINFVATNANTEYSISIPNNTRQFVFRIREDDAKSIIYFSSGASNYVTVRRGCNYSVDQLATNNVTIYFKVLDKTNRTVELLYWV